MTPNAPTVFLSTVMLGAGAMFATVGFSFIWIVFAVTLVVTSAVAIHRAIPRRER